MSFGNLVIGDGSATHAAKNLFLYTSNGWQQVKNAYGVQGSSAGSFALFASTPTPGAAPGMSLTDSSYCSGGSGSAAVNQVKCAWTNPLGYNIDMSFYLDGTLIQHVTLPPSTLSYTFAHTSSSNVPQPNERVVAFFYNAMGNGSSFDNTTQPGILTC